jgi:membrane protease YdiL (CAAX protease family)
LVSYFLFAFGFSWLMFLPGLLVYYGVLSLSAQAVRSFAIAGLLGPILSGFIMTGLIEGWPGISRLLRRIVRWRVGLRWYLFALIGLPAVMVLATIIRPGALESLDVSAQPITLAYLNAFVGMAIIGGPLFEEPGWTGFAQPRLQQMHGPLLGGLLLGGLWALWHLPGFLIPSEDIRDIPPRGTVPTLLCSLWLSWVCV